MLAAQDPSLREKPGFKAILSNDREAMARFDHVEIASLLAVTHAGMTPDAFEEIAKNWLARGTAPKVQTPLQTMRLPRADRAAGVFGVERL